MTTSDDIRAQFDRAIQASRAGQHREALDMLERLLQSPGLDAVTVASARGYMGGIYLHELDDCARAEINYEQSIALSPKSERASLGLFHALIGQDRTEEAVAEARRFLRLRPSESYQQLLRDFEQETK